MRAARDAWSHLTPEAVRRYVAFLLVELPRLAAHPLAWHRRIGPRSRKGVLRAALDAARGTSGLALEFGVYRGHSLRLSARAQPERRFIGFDSFTGFPEDARPDWQLDFATIGLPDVPANCTLVPGWFDQTLPGVLAAESGPVAFVNIDCDLYSSTASVLTLLVDRLRPGAVIYFDELLNYDTHLWNELLALFEFVEASGMGIEWIACDRKVRTADVALPLLARERYPSWAEDVAAGYGRGAALRLTARREPGDADAAEVDRLAESFDDLTRRLRQGRLVKDYCPPDERP